MGVEATRGGTERARIKSGPILPQIRSEKTFFRNMDKPQGAEKWHTAIPKRSQRLPVTFVAPADYGKDPPARSVVRIRRRNLR